MPVAIILKGYPRLSETFIAQEILALERRGLDVRIVSLRHPTDPATHPVHKEIRAPVTYLPEYLYQEPWRVLRAVWSACRSVGFRAAWKAWMRDLVRDPTPNRVRRFGQACVLSTELGADVDWFHAHYLHTPSSVTRYAALMTGRDWSVSAHAKDIWIIPDWEIEEKLACMAWLVTCTHYGAKRLRALARDESKIQLAYHGLDLARFPPPPARLSVRDGGSPDDPVVITSVGRAVAKKGYDDLLSALALLPDSLHWRFRHIGGGDLLAQLKRQAAELGIADRIDWLGPQPQSRVLEILREADIFALTCKVAPDGDRDGLPNVLMEAQSQRVPVLATTVAAIPELVQDGQTGLLVEPGNVAQIAAALTRFAREPETRQRIGLAGETRVRSTFAFDTCIETIADRFELSKETLAA